MIIINARVRQQFHAKPGCQEWITAVERVCANGCVVSPLVICKAKSFQFNEFRLVFVAIGGLIATGRDGQAMNRVGFAGM